MVSIVRFLTSETAPNRPMVGLTRATTANTVPASTNETYLILAIGIVCALYTIIEVNLVHSTRPLRQGIFQTNKPVD